MPPPPLSFWHAQGALLGLAVGDALGAPFEFSTPTAARATASRGLEMTGGGPWAPGEWTDDTDMALALAESIVDHGLIDLDDVARRYIAWADSDPKDIGNTTRAALQGASGAEDARNRARALHEHTGRTAGNGTVMRCTPIALAAVSREEAREAAIADALLTHHDRAAGLASAALCLALMNVADMEEPYDSIEVADFIVEGHRDLQLALGAAKRGHEPELAELAERQLGTAWTALAIGLYAVENFRDFESGVSWAISLGGDTDTNAAVAGAVLGCRDGVGGIPQRWRDALIDVGRIERAASGLIEVASAKSSQGLYRGATMWPEHHLELGKVGVRLADVHTAVALSRGRLEKSYGHVDDNEDVVVAYAGARATLIALADGHNGSVSANVAIHHVIERLGQDPPPHLGDAEFVELFHGAGEAVLERQSHPARGAPSRGRR